MTANTTTKRFMRGGGVLHPDCYVTSLQYPTDGLVLPVVKPCSDGSTIIAGHTNNITQPRVLITKLNGLGEFVWQRLLTYSDDLDGVAAICYDSALNIYVVMRRWIGKALLVKFAPDGTLLWQSLITTSGVFYANCMVLDSAGSIYIGGSVGSYDLAVIKLSATGDSEVWQLVHNYGTSESSSTDKINDMCLSPAEDFIYAAGQIMTNNTATPIIYKINTATKAYTAVIVGTVGQCQGLDHDKDGNIYTTTDTKDVIKMTANLALIWIRRFATMSSPSRLVIDNYGGIFIGHSSSNTFTKISSDGDALYTITLAPSGAQLYAPSFAFDADNTLYVCGNTLGYVVYTVKMPPDGSSFTIPGITYAVGAAPASTTPAVTLSGITLGTATNVLSFTSVTGVSVSNVSYTINTTPFQA